MNVGEQIKYYRNQKGYTQKQLGELCDMADSAIRRYEAGRAKPKIETLAKIANALDLTVEDFLDLTCIEVLNQPNDSNRKAKSSLENNLLSHFNKLNINGKEKAIEQIEMLTKIHEYKK